MAIAEIEPVARVQRDVTPPATISPGPKRRWQLVKRAALPTYFTATWPLRLGYLPWLSIRGQAPVVIVALHRVADDRATPWTTPTDVFRRGVAWLERRFELVSLAEAQRRVNAAENRVPTVSITFDDGYFDNCEVALPLLIDRGIPLTYFVTSDAVLRGACFQHDLMLGQQSRPNTLQQIRELADAGVEIGAHTRTHADLGSIHQNERLYDEVVVARDELQDAIGCRIRYFAFPFGQHANLNRQVFQMAADAGFEAVVSAYGGYNFPGGDAFHLQRPCVDGSLARLKNWALIDPWRLWTISRYAYGDLP